MAWSVRQKLSFGLLILLALVSWGSWRILERAVLVEGASSFVLPSLALVSLVGVLLAGSLLWQERSMRFLAAVFLVLWSVMIAPALSHGIIALIAVGCAYAGLQRIQRELVERIHIKARTSLWLGLTPILLACSLLVSSQYYIHARQLSWDRLVPSFNLAEGVGPSVLRLLAPIYPEINTLQDTSLTVDTFLEQMYTKKQSPDLTSPSVLEPVYIEEELKRTKQELSRLLGREILGQENIQLLFNEIIQRKTLALFSNQEEHFPVPLLPLLLSILLFFTVYPLLALVAPLIVIIVTGLFYLSRSLGWVQVTKRSIEQEILLP